MIAASSATAEMPAVPGECKDAPGAGRGIAPATQGLIALLMYLAAWLAAKASPLLIHPGWAQLSQGGMDPNFYVWSLRWWPYAIAHGLNPLHSSLVRVPAGADLAWITTIPPLALLAAPVTVLVGPVVSFNLLVVASLPVSAWAAFILCRRITCRFWPALAGGAVYGFSTYETSHVASGQLNLAFAPLLPLIAYLVLAWWEGKLGGRAFTALLGLAMAAQFYLFIETFAGLTVVLAVALAAGYALAGRRRRPVVARLIGLTGLAYLLALVLAAPYLRAALEHVPPGFVRDPSGQGLDLVSLVSFQQGGALGLKSLALAGGWHPPLPKGGYIGVPLLAIAAFLALFTWSRRLTRFLTIMFAFVVVAALGPAVKMYGRTLFELPWHSLWYLPIVRSSFPTRLMIFGSLALAVITASFLVAPPKKLPWLYPLQWLLAITGIFIVAASAATLQLSRGPGVPAFITTGEYRHYIAPGATIVVVSHTGNAGLLWQAETNFYPRLAGGFLNEVVTRRTALPHPVANLVIGKLTKQDILRFRSFVRAARVAAILVGIHTLRKWQTVLAKLGFRRRVFGRVILYRPPGGWS
ncbi:MAG TPA: hypothetical protein VFQ44_00750 [Streptosporangiaceae bacterium]|nr:hypothetical protein [Streptosporangiaceae bacterium]